MEQELRDLVECAHALIDYEDDDPLGGYAYLRGRGVTVDQIKMFKIGIGSPSVKMPDNTDDGSRFNRQYRGSMSGNIVFPIL